MIIYTIVESKYRDISDSYTRVRYVNESVQTHHRSLFKVLELKQMNLEMKETPLTQQLILNRQSITSSILNLQEQLRYIQKNMNFEI